MSSKIDKDTYTVHVHVISKCLAMIQERKVNADIFIHICILNACYDILNQVSVL